MALPQFTAQTSIYPAQRIYNTPYARSRSLTSALVPQDNCGGCMCDPGQCCHQNPSGCSCTLCTHVPPASFENQPEFLAAR